MMTERENQHSTPLDPAGVFPFRRGIYGGMYRDRLWTMRQYSGFGGPEQTNARFRDVIAGGGTGLSLAFDLPTQLGLDSDNPLSLGEVGRTGVAIDTVADMRRVFDGIDLAAISTSMTINAPAAVLLAFYVVAAESAGAGVDRADLRGTVQNDILKEYIARGTYIYPPQPSLRLVRDLFAWCANEVPRWNAISVSGYHIREAGATAVQELTFTLGNGRTYVEHLVAAGQDVNRVGEQLSFFFSVDNGFLEEIAKFRAARVLWAELMKEEFGANEKAARLRFHCQVAGSTLTAQQPLNNAVRVAVQALAAVLGGTQSLHTNSIDEALGLPTDETARLALRTQQVIAEETGVTDYVDPLGGSEAIERLTDRYIDETHALWKRIEEEGGMLAAVESGRIQAWIQQSAYQHQRSVESCDTVIVGVNKHTVEDEQPPAVLKIDPALERKAVERLKAHRAGRDQTTCDAALSALTAAARGDENLMPLIVKAAQTDATVGEICQAMKTVFGEHIATSGLNA